MASPGKGEALVVQGRSRSRKSIAHLPSTDDQAGRIDKENLTTDVAAMSNTKTSTGSPSRTGKKSRSKSIGPGGLDALMESAGNRRKSNVAPIVKSILKPTVPLSPLKEIPALASLRKGTFETAGGLFGGEGNEVTGTASGDLSMASQVSSSGRSGDGTGSTLEATSSIKADDPSKVALRTEDEQQAAARQRDEEEKRDMERKQAIERRDARRKSLANRRVSFAPEATLHTWDVVEYMQDSTNSSSSTASTRRASSTPGPSLPASPHPAAYSATPHYEQSEPPSTPPERVESTLPSASPAHQRDLHQRKRRRRSSGIPPMNFNNPADEFGSSSPYSGSSAVGSDDAGESIVIQEGIESSSSESSEGGDGDSTGMVLDDDETTIQSVASARSGSTASTGRLEAALNQAAAHAGTQRIEVDDHGEMTMEMADDEVTAAFQPWVQGRGPNGQPATNSTLLQGKGATNPFSPAFKAGIVPKTSPQSRPTEPEEEDMSMDMTSAIGAILPTRSDGQGNADRGRRRSMASRQRRASVMRRRSSGEGSSLGDETMDLTMAVGGIASAREEPGLGSQDGNDEELSMELTSVIGGVLPSLVKSTKSRRQSVAGRLDETSGGQAVESRRRESDVSNADESEMDMTVAVGGILPSISEGAENTTETATELSVTAAMAESLPVQLSTGTRSQAKALMELETDSGQLTSSPFQEHVRPESPSKSTASVPATATASATGSPRMTRGKGKATLRRSAGDTLPGAPSPLRKQLSTPTKKPATPQKQLTPTPSKPTIPSKTPPSKNVTFRSASPKKLFKSEIRRSGGTPKPASSRKLFTEDGLRGVSTPSIVLTPRRRGNTGVGIDREGMGSPRVAALLDRRRSIGDDAKSFTPSEGGDERRRLLRFADPKAMEVEIGKDREVQAQREDGRSILQREANNSEADGDKDATVNLKEMIQSLTPKKRINGRKSLHVGAAKGLLGKRPAELDEDEGSDESSPKRLMGRDGSPVKNVTLPPPPSKTETTGRLTTTARKSLVEMDANCQTITPTTSASPAKIETATTPKPQGRFKEAEAPSSAVKASVLFGDRAEASPGHESGDTDETDERIHLQDFLNLTSIRFMELTTTKRRPTLAPNATLGSAKKGQPEDSKPSARGRDTELERCVVAGACTVPMLELYQHSCHELKKYISEGRSIVREIESDTFEENPPLFREYISASPDVRFIMDNQFKNVKTHARLLSKAMWYEWRMKLLDGLREGLCKVSEGMDADDESLARQEELLAPITPGLVDEHDRLVKEHANLTEQAAELANCDQAELDDARERVVKAEQEIEEKRQLLAHMQAQTQAKETGLAQAAERKSMYLEEIREAERIREECRGWSAGEVSAFKAKAESLEREHGWIITSMVESSVTMEFQKSIQLSFDGCSFRPNGPLSEARKDYNSPFDIIYVGDRDENQQRPLTTEKSFFIQRIKMQLQGMRQGTIRIKDLLAFVSLSWNKADAVTEEIRLLNLRCPTEAIISSERSMSVRSSLLIQILATKVDVVFDITTSSQEASVSVNTTPSAVMVYGERYNEARMSEFLAGQVHAQVLGAENEVRGTWGRAVGELEEKLLARGKK